MKQIQVSDEIYDFLINLSKEIKSQGQRATATPYFFQVRETKEVPAHKGQGEEVLWSPNYEIELRTDQEKIDWIKEHEEEFIGKDGKEELKEVGNHSSTYELDEILEEVGFESFNVENGYTYSNAFFTSKACDEHIRINKHNLNYPVNYLTHAYRNKEMEMMFKFLIDLTK